jgi:hypothetical protein
VQSVEESLYSGGWRAETTSLKQCPVHVSKKKKQQQLFVVQNSTLIIIFMSALLLLIFVNPLEWKNK